MAEREWNRVPLRPRRHLDDLDFVVKCAGFGLDGVRGQKTALDDRRPDLAPLGRAPVRRERGEPLLVRDAVAQQEKLSEANGLQRGRARRLHT